MNDYASLYPSLQQTYSMEAVIEITRAVRMLGISIEELGERFNTVNGVNIKPKGVWVINDLKRHEWQEK